jgi:hypothetical protein
MSVGFIIKSNSSKRPSTISRVVQKWTKIKDYYHDRCFPTCLHCHEYERNCHHHHHHHDRLCTIFRQHEGWMSTRVKLVTMGILSIYLSVCLSIYLSVCLSIYLSVCLSVGLPVYLPLCLSVCLSSVAPSRHVPRATIYFTHQHQTEHKHMAICKVLYITITRNEECRYVPLLL